MGIDKLNAKDARTLAGDYIDNELCRILENITDQATKGKRILYIYKSLLNKTTDDLKSRGFKVTSGTSMSIQKENLYYSIHW